MKVLVTGAAGFIGMHACEFLLARGDDVTGIDNLNDYCDPSLKQARLERLARFPNFRFETLDIADAAPLMQLVKASGATRVLHLAAQAGVRYSIQNPGAYVQSNLVGFANILEACRWNGIEHLAYASSSGVYGNRDRMPWREQDALEAPVSFYAATKKANEAMAQAYSHLYRLPVTGLRFFTVYGPWGRPDMAYFSFTQAIVEGRPIDVYNEGRMTRDFTYVDDVVQAVARVLDKVPFVDAAHPSPSRIFNVGNRQGVALGDFIATLERLIGRPATRNLLPMQPGDVPGTCADTSALDAWVGFHPDTPLATGLDAFVRWYRQYRPG